jgi:hypothetical protein
MISLWANSVHTVDEYSQLVTPQALYTLYALLQNDVTGYALLQNDVTGALNGFVPFPGTSWKLFFKALQLFGARYYVAEPGGASIAAQAGYRAVTMPRHPLVGVAGLWHIYEFPNPNIGNYSPTEVVTAASAPEMVLGNAAGRFRLHKASGTGHGTVRDASASRRYAVVANPRRLSSVWSQQWHLARRSSAAVLQLLPCAR